MDKQKRTLQYNITNMNIKSIFCVHLNSSIGKSSIPYTVVPLYTLYTYVSVCIFVKYWLSHHPWAHHHHQWHADCCICLVFLLYLTFFYFTIWRGEDEGHLFEKMGACLIYSGWVLIWEGTCQNVSACLSEEIIYGWSVLRNHETFEMGLYPVCSINLVIIL